MSTLALSSRPMGKALGLTLLLSLASGCGGDGGAGASFGILCQGAGVMITTSSPPAQRSCCDANGAITFKGPGSEQCPDSPDSNNGGSLYGGAQNIQTASTALEQAGQLSGGAPTATFENPNLISSAATVGGTTVAGQPRGGAAGGDSGKLAKPGSGSGEDGSGAAPRAQSSGSGLDAGSTKSLASAARIDLTPDLNPNKSLRGYAGGRGGTGRTGGSGKSLFGNDSGGLSAGGVQENSYAGGRAISSTAMAGDDPEDYFGRLDTFADLFKVIERRYRTKAVDWEKARLQLQLR